MDAAGLLYVPLTEYKVTDPAAPSALSVDTPGDNRELSVENRFIDALENDQAGSGEGESMDETLSEAGEKMDVGTTPDEGQRTAISVPASRGSCCGTRVGTTGQTRPPRPWDLPTRILSCLWRVNPPTWDWCS